MTALHPGDVVLVLAGVNKGVRATFKGYNDKGRAICKGSGTRLHRITVKPEKLKLMGEVQK